MYRLLTAVMAFLVLAACEATQLNEPPEQLGEFKARVLHVYTEKALQWPLSRKADPSEWNKPMEDALRARLARYDGRQEYDVAVTLEGFLLATPGIPVVVNPKSVAVVNVFVYDVAKKEFLVKKKQMQIFEDTTGESAILGSGYSRTKEEQIAGLSLRIADAIEELLAEEHREKGWFDLRAGDSLEVESTAVEDADSTTTAPVSE